VELHYPWLFLDIVLFFTPLNSMPSDSELSIKGSVEVAMAAHVNEQKRQVPLILAT
jgi:hypothetical protein